MAEASQGHYGAIVVGAGIVGLAVARELRRRAPDARIAVIDQAQIVAAHQSGHNSGVIHGGIYYTPGSLKARLCVEGSRLMYDYCDEHGIPHERCGKLIVARHEGELGRLDELERRGRANGVPGLRRVAGRDIPDIEPNAVGVQALHAPGTGIVDYGRVAEAIAEELRAGGVELLLGRTVQRVTPQGAGAIVRHDRGQLRADRVIVCAGLWSDRIARRCGAPADPRIVPFRGAYLRLQATDPPVVRGMVYPVPDPELPFLGVHVTPHVAGQVMLGPTALAVASRAGYRLRRVSARDVWETASWPGTWRVAGRFWRTGLDEVRLAASRRAFVAACAEYVPSLTVEDLDGTTAAGVRAQAVGRDGSLVDDFVIARDGPVSHVRNAPSPAATSAFALAAEILRRTETGR
ncbi:MAG: L-2-hydroxyglutarate oxidase [Ornithinimicrobium sp.]|uniref:L-2-hydroxyglutarate oxidase n=1 Tax=Ornithinimicrobium sp. TaxID=1977084 RepID=UPI003D9B1AC7